MVERARRILFYLRHRIPAPGANQLDLEIYELLARNYPSSTEPEFPTVAKKRGFDDDLPG